MTKQYRDGSGKGRGSEAGFALISPSSPLMLLTILGLALATTTSTELQIATNYRWSQQALYNAEGGGGRVVQPDRRRHEPAGPPSCRRGPTRFVAPWRRAPPGRAGSSAGTSSAPTATSGAAWGRPRAHRGSPSHNARFDGHAFGRAFTGPPRAGGGQRRAVLGRRDPAGRPDRGLPRASRVRVLEVPLTLSLAAVGDPVSGLTRARKAGRPSARTSTAAARPSPRARRGSLAAALGGANGSWA